MILVDTSIWVDHLRNGNDRLALMLEQGLVLTHPFVIGELACGFLRNRREILELLQSLPCTGMAGHAEVLHLVESKSLYGRGLGWIDAHLVASAMLSPAYLWTSDRRLRLVADSLDLGPV
jgi:predicted nucleic acid-binding protein